MSEAAIRSTTTASASRGSTTTSGAIVDLDAGLRRDLTFDHPQDREVLFSAPRRRYAVADRRLGGLPWDGSA